MFVKKASAFLPRSLSWRKSMISSYLVAGLSRLIKSFEVVLGFVQNIKYIYVCFSSHTSDPFVVLDW